MFNLKSQTNILALKTGCDHSLFDYLDEESACILSIRIFIYASLHSIENDSELLV